MTTVPHINQNEPLCIAESEEFGGAGSVRAVGPGDEDCAAGVGGLKNGGAPFALGPEVLPGKDFGEEEGEEVVDYGDEGEECGEEPHLWSWGGVGMGFMVEVGGGSYDGVEGHWSHCGRSHGFVAIALRLPRL